MCVFDVTIDVRSMLGDVVAVRTLKSGRLATLVCNVSMKSAVPSIRLAAVLTRVCTSRTLLETGLTASSWFVEACKLKLKWVSVG